MRGLSRAKQQLSDALLGLHEEAMLLEELDGFVAGILLCPEMIPPSAWLPLVWNRDGGDEPAFDDLDHANRVMGLVMEYYNDVALTLFERPGDYAPLFAVDERNGDVLWEMWIEGFDKAARLRPEAWLPVMAADTRTGSAWRGLMKLVSVVCSENVDLAQHKTLSPGAPGNIRDWVVDINDLRLGRATRPRFPGEGRPVPPSSGKVGRNEPCPCGSGKKYKKCCGLR